MQFAKVFDFCRPSSAVVGERDLVVPFLQNIRYIDHDDEEEHLTTWMDIIDKNENVNDLHNHSSSISLEDAVNSPKTQDMMYWVLTAVVLIIVRRFAERHLSKPLGIYLGIKDTPALAISFIPCRVPEAIPILESFYRSNKSCTKTLDRNHVASLSQRTNLRDMEVHRWFRRRRALDRPSKLSKFTESGWRFICYVCSTLLGLYTIWDKPWTWAVEKRWMGFPNHSIAPETRLYYMYGSGLYLSLLLTQAFDVKRKDFWEMLVHHVVTLSLLATSWTMNLTRVGVLILLLHDCADVLLESAKMANYAKREGPATWIFVAFTGVWSVTRLYVFPKHMIWENHVEMIKVLPDRLCYILNALLLVLFSLHLFWTYFICKVAVATINHDDNKQRDARSSSSESESSAEETETSKQEIKTGGGTRHSRVLNHNSKKSSSFSSLLARIDSNQRRLIKRISAEIM